MAVRPVELDHKFRAVGWTTAWNALDARLGLQILLVDKRKPSKVLGQESGTRKAPF